MERRPAKIEGMILVYDEVNRVPLKRIIRRDGDNPSRMTYFETWDGQIDWIHDDGYIVE